mmetsp:Transcript_44987/g.90794  ORF Transcript_44987/g.90794 Transcript_44987/m.90794 type:complete len:395 (-) Transcript_44987:102-1286(-)
MQLRLRVRCRAPVRERPAQRELLAGAAGRCEGGRRLRGLSCLGPGPLQRAAEDGPPGPRAARTRRRGRFRRAAGCPAGLRSPRTRSPRRQSPPRTGRGALLLLAAGVLRQGIREGAGRLSVPGLPQAAAAQVGPPGGPARPRLLRRLPEAGAQRRHRAGAPPGEHARRPRPHPRAGRRLRLRGAGGERGRHGPLRHAQGLAPPAGGPAGAVARLLLRVPDAARRLAGVPLRARGRPRRPRPAVLRLRRPGARERRALQAAHGQRRRPGPPQLRRAPDQGRAARQQHRRREVALRGRAAPPRGGQHLREHGGAPVGQGGGAHRGQPALGARAAGGRRRGSEDQLRHLQPDLRRGEGEGGRAARREADGRPRLLSRPTAPLLAWWLKLEPWNWLTA